MTKLPIPQLLDAIRIGLAAQRPDDTRPERNLRVERVRLLNDTTLLAEFKPYSTYSIDVRKDATYIISFLYSVLAGNNLATFRVDNYAVRALSEDGEELMYAVSSTDGARCASEGKPIEWVRRTLFQDNTPDHRLAMAKNRISALETALRHIISEMLEREDKRWWTSRVPNSVRSITQKTYEAKFGSATTDGKALIEYTYLPNLKQIIVENWATFASLFADQGKLVSRLDELNVIRRDEAHNREISTTQCKQLDAIYNEIMGPIAERSPDLVPGYVEENWFRRVQRIMDDHAQRAAAPAEEMRNDLTVMFEHVEQSIVDLDDTLARLASVLVPPGKARLQERLLKILSTTKLCLEEMLAGAAKGDLQAVEDAAERLNGVDIERDKFLSELFGFQ
jgi:hypothetical protein